MSRSKVWLKNRENSTYRYVGHVTCRVLGQSRTSQRHDPAVAISAVLGCQVDDVPDQQFLVSGWLQLPVLRRSQLTEDSAGSTLCDVESSSDVIDALPETRRAW